jgi:predicted NBD/HSP70 family sugar kinase
MRSIGVVITEHMAAGLVEDGAVTGEIRCTPAEALLGLPAEDLIAALGAEIEILAAGSALDALGVAFPGIVRNGVIEESPNLPQLKGLQASGSLQMALRDRGINLCPGIFNDADVVATGIAAIREHLDRIVRVWTLGNGIGFGHYPSGGGVWEGGHTVVSLDPNEKLCGCGGRGHLEGIMGHRAMRLRFLDREPEEVFAAAKTGDATCAEFVQLWHRALAAATATSIHLEGAGKFYITGMNAHFVNLGMVNSFLQEMVKMSPLQAYGFEIIERSDDLAVLGAAVNALRT